MFLCSQADGHLGHVYLLEIVTDPSMAALEELFL